MENCISGSKCIKSKCKRHFYNNHSGRCAVYHNLETLLYSSISETEKSRIIKFLQEIVEKKGLT